MEIELSIKDENHIILPAGVATSDLSLSEIGAIACLACLQTQIEKGTEMGARLESKEMIDALTALKLRGLFDVTVEEGKIVFHLNLESFATG